MDHIVTICEKEPTVSDVILLVSEEDGSDTYYKLHSNTTNMLIRIHNKRFIFSANTVASDDNSVHMDSEITNFLETFRHGRYTTKWKNFAELIQVIEVADDDARCLPYNYCVSLRH